MESNLNETGKRTTDDDDEIPKTTTKNNDESIVCNDGQQMLVTIVLDGNDNARVNVEPQVPSIAGQVPIRTKQRGSHGNSLRVSLLEAVASRSSTSCPTTPSQGTSSAVTTPTVGTPTLTPQTPQTPLTPGGSRLVPPIDPKTGFRYQWDASVNDNVLPVRCKNVSGQLDKTKFGSGGRGKCILVNRCWYTPSEFEIMGGRGNCKDWKRSIRYGGRTLQCLVEEGIIQPHAISCTCTTCCDDTTASGPVRLFVPYKRKKPNKNEETLTSTPEPTSGPASPQSGDVLPQTTVTSNNLTRTTTVAEQSSYESMATPGVYGAESLTPVTQNSLSITPDITEYKHWWQLEEKVNTLINYGQQVKQLLAQLKEQTMASRETALTQLRNQLENEKRQAVIRARQELRSNVVGSLEQTATTSISDYEKCANCGRDADSTCSLCHRVTYCSTFCQQKDWKNHIVDCSEI